MMTEFFTASGHSVDKWVDMSCDMFVFINVPLQVKSS